jgi:hypothetical protein
MQSVLVAHLDEALALRPLLPEAEVFVLNGLPAWRRGRLRGASGDAGPEQPRPGRRLGGARPAPRPGAARGAPGRQRHGPDRRGGMPTATNHGDPSAPALSTLSLDTPCSGTVAETCKARSRDKGSQLAWVGRRLALVDARRGDSRAVAERPPLAPDFSLRAALESEARASSRRFFRLVSNNNTSGRSRG